MCVCVCVGVGQEPETFHEPPGARPPAARRPAPHTFKVLASVWLSHTGLFTVPKDPKKVPKPEGPERVVPHPGQVPVDIESRGRRAHFSVQKSKNFFMTCPGKELFDLAIILKMAGQAWRA